MVVRQWAPGDGAAGRHGRRLRCFVLLDLYSSCATQLLQAKRTFSEYLLIECFLGSRTLHITPLSNPQMQQRRRDVQLRSTAVD